MEDVTVNVGYKRYQQLLAIEEKQEGALLVQSDLQKQRDLDAVLSVFKKIINNCPNVATKNQTIDFINEELEKFGLRITMVGGYTAIDVMEGIVHEVRLAGIPKPV